MISTQVRGPRGPGGAPCLARGGVRAGDQAGQGGGRQEPAGGAGGRRLPPAGQHRQAGAQVGRN